VNSAVSRPETQHEFASSWALCISNNTNTGHLPNRQIIISRELIQSRVQDRADIETAKRQIISRSRKLMDGVFAWIKEISIPVQEIQMKH
jgi:type III secretory pathway lipoprotein EscJ